MNTIPQTLRRSLILNSAMEAFKHRLVSLGLFSTVLRNLPLEGNNEIDIPYIPLATSASKDFDGSYKFDKGDLESRKITVNKRKYQSLTYTSEEKARQPYFDPVVLGRLKGEKLAEDVLLDILSVITTQNFGNAILTTTAANFDTDDIIDLETRLDELEWPDAPRGMILKSSYLANVKKDIKESGGISNFGFSSLGNLPNLLGFSFSKFKASRKRRTLAGLCSVSVGDYGCSRSHSPDRKRYEATFHLHHLYRPADWVDSRISSLGRRR